MHAVYSVRLMHPLRAVWVWLFVIGLLMSACTKKVHLTEETIPGWMDTVLTVRETAQMSPAMLMAQRLSELQRAKAAAYDRLTASVLALSLTGELSVAQTVERDPGLRPAVEAYVRRAASVNAQWALERIDVVASVVVGAELLELLRVERVPPAPSDGRSGPSTGIVRPIMGE